MSNFAAEPKLHQALSPWPNISLKMATFRQGRMATAGGSTFLIALCLAWSGLGSVEFVDVLICFDALIPAPWRVFHWHGRSGEVGFLSAKQGSHQKQFFFLPHRRVDNHDIHEYYMGVSKNRGIPKWMVYNGNPIKMDDLGGKPTIFGNIHIYIYRLYSTTSIFNFTFRKLGFDFFIPFMEWLQAAQWLPHLVGEDGQHVHVVRLGTWHLIWVLPVGW